jgi:hypothetical protein
MALSLKTDDLITMLGQWSTKENYDPARHLAFNLAVNMMTTHLSAGHDVIVPHLLTDLEEVEALETVAKELNVPFIEILLYSNKLDALDRVFERGTRGEPGAPPLTSEDRPEFEELYDNVLSAAQTRDNVHRIDSVKDGIEDTYQRVIEIINKGVSQ